MTEAEVATAASTQDEERGVDVEEEEPEPVKGAPRPIKPVRTRQSFSFQQLSVLEHVFEHEQLPRQVRPSFFPSCARPLAHAGHP